MNILLRDNIAFSLTRVYLTLILATTRAYSQEAKSIPTPIVTPVVKLGMAEDSAVASEWIEAIRQ